jgi:hypothetical protein
MIQGAHRSIFRRDAIRRYAQAQDKAVLPRFVCPRTFLCLWILLGLLFLAGSYVTWVAHGLLLGVHTVRTPAIRSHPGQ